LNKEKSARLSIRCNVHSAKELDAKKQSGSIRNVRVLYFAQGTIMSYFTALNALYFLDSAQNL